MLGCKPVSVPMIPNVKMMKEDGDLLEDKEQYRKIVGKLMYLTITKPDITFAVNKLCQFSSAPRISHLSGAYRVLQYIKGTVGQGFFYAASPDLTLKGFADSDWASCSDSRCSTTGFLMFVGDSLVSWRSKKQHTVSRSSVEAEYRALALATCEIVWLYTLLTSLKTSPPVPILFSDSSSCPAIDKEEDEMGKRLTSSSLDVVEVKERKRLWELLAEAQAEDALDLSGSDRFAFSVDDAISAGNAPSVGSKRWLLLSKLKQDLSKQGISGRNLFPWKSGVEENENEEVDNVGVEEWVDKRRKRRKAGTIDHELVLKAMPNGLEATEQAFLEMTDKVLDTNPELALMGSCLLVALMRDDDVYIMNIGDSRALVAQYQVEETGASVETSERVEERHNDVDKEVENKEPLVVDSSDSTVNNEAPLPQTKLVALQLTTDHSTSIEDEVTRIKNEHPDDNHCIVNDRVKGRLKVTRAFGAGFLKQPKLNDALLEMFRNEYIGTDPYISCTPSLHHYRLTENDQFMVLSSDGLYQYLSNGEVVALAMEKFPDGDPAQHVIQELLVRAAKKAGMDFHELLDIPQGDRRKYHDDCTVLVIALGGSRIWKSSGKYL